LSGAFDAAWYRAFYPDSVSWDPVVHYLARGGAKGHRPHVLFDRQWWREATGRDGHADAFVDYLTAPERWTLSVSPYLTVRPVPETARLSRHASPLGLSQASGGREGLEPTALFDADFYARHNPDVVAAGLDPLLHFISNGGREGRSPSASFDAFWYLSVNADVKASGEEPLRHFLMRGARQGRAPHRAIDPAILLAHAPGSGLAGALAAYQREGRHRLDAHTHARLPPPGAAAPLLDDWPWRNAAVASARGRQLVLIAGAGDEHRRDRLHAMAACRSGPQPWCVALDAPAHDTRAERDTPTLCFAQDASDKLLQALLRAASFAGPHLAVSVEAPDGHPAHARAAAAGLAPPPVPAAPLADLQISAVVPSYKHGAFLEQRLATIVAQRRPPCEIIIIDDASQDDSLARAHAFANKAPLPVQVIAREHNSGSPFTAWAEGARLARGDLLWIAESDDLADPRLLERLAPFLERDAGMVLAYSQSAAIGPHGERLADGHLFYTDDIDPARWEAPYQISGEAEIAEALAIKNTIPNVSAALFRRAPFAAAVPRIAADRYCGDWRLYAQLAAQGRIGYSPEPLNRTRRHAGNATAEGERGLDAIREAEAIRLALWQNPYVPTATIRAGFAQHIREVESRRARHTLPIAPFEEEPAFRAFREAVAALLKAREGSCRRALK
jgi:hypothetical protein